MTRRPPTGVSDPGHPPYEEEFREIGHILERDAGRIMQRWFERASEEQVHAAPHQRREAMNDLFEMLQSLGQRLYRQSGHALDAASQLAREHGEQRFGLKWDIIDLVRDYEILQGVILEHLGQTLGERLSYRQAMIIATVVNGATGHAIESYTAMIRDRLEQQVRRQQSALRQLTLDLTDAEHRERQRLASRLHDDLQQMLLAMRMRIDAALRKTPVDLAAVQEARNLTGQAMEMARNLAAELYPRVLEHQGLPEAVEWLAGMFQQWYGLNVTVDLQVPRDSQPGPLPMRRLIYDTIRELMFNVVKHAKTDQAWVRICCGDQSPWRIEVEDHGIGSAETVKAASPSGRSFGLGSVRQRIEHIGGTMQVNSSPDQGTRIILSVPLQKE